MKTWLLIGLYAILTLVNTSCAIAGVASEQLILPDLYEASIVELQHGLDARHFTSVDLVKAYFARIEEVNLNGPSLRAVLETNPSALAQAAALDLERKTKGKRAILHGIPILLKDNIATVASERMNTTAGSFNLLNSIVLADASVVTKLRKGGAIILGKANLSEFAYVRGNIANGWSGRGGQATSAYYPNADPCGSSSGLGIATSIGLTVVALGTETDGSTTCLSAWNSVVGIKPTLGLTSRAGASSHQDSVGPMARTVADAAALLNVIAGKDLNDNFTLAQPSVVPDFTKALDERSLKGKSIGVPRYIYLDDDITGGDPSIKSAFEDALKTIRALGATVIDPADVSSASDLLNTNEVFVVETDMKIQLNKYFKSLVMNPSGVRSLADLIKFNDDHPDLEKPSGYEDQSTFEEAKATEGFNSTYFAALASNKDVGATRGLDAAFREHKLDAIVLPVVGIVSVASALSGYPIVTVPLGFYPDNTTAVPDGPQTLFPAPGLPFGLSFLGMAYSEFQLISFAYAYEQRTQIRLQRKAFAAAVPVPAIYFIPIRNHCVIGDGRIGVDGFPDLYEASLLDLREGLDSGKFSSVDLIKAYFARIEEVNLKGPSLRAILETNPSALQQARILDDERKGKGTRSLLHGIPILLKDNIGTLSDEGMNTTAGSYSLLGSVVPDDAGVVKRLRRAGAIILGKANLSEFAHYRGKLASGWSGRGGQTTNAYFPNADPCGSSSGSGVAVSIGLAPAALGTETDGSIVCPAAWNNIVGIKPTVGLTSRAGVIPASAHQDTVGPMARSVSDAAILLSVIAGRDHNDNYTFSQTPIPDFTRALKREALAGKRIGVIRRPFWAMDVTAGNLFVKEEFNKALNTIRDLGATVVDPADLPSADELKVSNNESIVISVDMKVQLDQYFKSLIINPSGVRSLTDLIKFNNDHIMLEEPPGFEDQSGFTDSEATSGYNSSFFQALTYDRELGATRGIDAVLKRHRLDALVVPVVGLVTSASAVSGYPIVTVPLGFYPNNTVVQSVGPRTFYPAPNVPFGLSFLGTAYSEFQLIGFAYAYEQKTKTRYNRKAYPAALPKTQLKDVVTR